MTMDNNIFQANSIVIISSIHSFDIVRKFLILHLLVNTSITHFLFFFVSNSRS
jgi:hypothetical protein